MRGPFGLQSVSLPSLVSLSAENKKETSFPKGTWQGFSNYQQSSEISSTLA